jgi:hypothetical protein
MAPLTVERVTLTPVGAEQNLPAGGRDWYTLEASVRNGTETPLHVVSDLRAIEYDGEHRTLLCSFAEKEEAGALVSLPAPVTTVVVDPGGEATLSARLASPITSVEVAEGGELRLVETRVDADVDLVRCRVAYSEKEPPDVDLTSLAPLARTVEWPAATGTGER